MGSPRFFVVRINLHSYCSIDLSVNKLAKIEVGACHYIWALKTQKERGMYMKFIDKEHENFFYGTAKRYKENGGSVDCYVTPMFYLMGLSADTRRQFGTLFNLKERVILQEGLHAGWQTGTSMKICRLAFNLWNGYCYEADEEDKVSDRYVTDNIFCCSYAEYFFEAIRLRYPEYCHVAC